MIDNSLRPASWRRFEAVRRELLEKAIQASILDRSFEDVDPFDALHVLLIAGFAEAVPEVGAAVVEAADAEGDGAGDGVAAGHAADSFGDAYPI